MAEEKKNKKTKRPTALKRDIQNEKRRMINKSFKTGVRTAMRTFEEALKSKDREAINKSLNGVYSVMDKGAKRGVYKTNKAARIKARAHKRVATTA